jgi:hypothetical protein
MQEGRWRDGCPIRDAAAMLPWGPALAGAGIHANEEGIGERPARRTAAHAHASC